jgi:hypothetical protein
MGICFRYEIENLDGGFARVKERFWLIDNYILQVVYTEARKLFDNLL